MIVAPAVRNRIHELGGSTPSEFASLKDFLLGTTFPHYLYDKDWDVYGVDDFFAANRSSYDNDVESFLDLIEQYYFAKHDFACGQHFWQPELFTPFTPGTENFKEWESFFAEYGDLSPVRSLCGDGELEFLQIIHSYGYPDHFYICLQDPSPEDPTVFGTDHEMFFQEIDAYGSLSEFLDRYCTRGDFREIIRDYLADKA